MRIETPKLWLPRTGQTTSYADGDDGYFQAGNPRVTRFVDNLNGTVSDRATGLQWVKQPELIIPGAVGIHATNQIQSAEGEWAGDHGTYTAGDLVVGDGDPDALFHVCIQTHTAAGDKEPPNATYWRETVWTASAANLTTPATMTWTDGCANSLALEYAGYDDWRIPHISELFSLINHGDGGAAVAAIDRTAFPNTQCPNPDYGYWTGTSWAGYPPYAKTVVFRTTNSCPGTGVSDKTAARYVRPVRGGRLNSHG